MEKGDQNHISQSAAEIRDVFGASDDEDEPVYAVRNEIEQDLPVSIESQNQFIYYFCIFWCRQACSWLWE